jgi:hypothetical protein
VTAACPAHDTAFFHITPQYFPFVGTIFLGTHLGSQPLCLEGITEDMSHFSGLHHNSKPAHSTTKGYKSQGQYVLLQPSLCQQTLRRTYPPVPALIDVRIYGQAQHLMVQPHMDWCRYRASHPSLATPPCLRCLCF